MKKIIASSIVGLILIGCGGGSSSSLSQMDNSSVVGVIETLDGYYAGENVFLAPTLRSGSVY